MRASLPVADRSLMNTEVDQQMAFVQKVIEALRQIRSEMGIAPSREISVQMRKSIVHPQEILGMYEGYLRRLARVNALTFIEEGTRPKLSASAVVDGEEFFAPLEGLINIEVERSRLQKEIDRLSTMAESIRKKLANPNFAERAPADVVAREREKLSSFELNLEKLGNNLEQLGTE